MSVLAIKETLRAQVANNQAAVIANTGFKSVIVFRQVPKLEKLGSGFYVAIGPWERTETRLTTPRGGGQKQVKYRFQVMVEAVGKDEQTRGDDFDVALENMQQLFRSANVNVQITDPVTSGTSWLMELGETIESHNAEPVPAAPQGLVRFIADIFVSATEYITA